jgi:hypothetical protein
VAGSAKVVQNTLNADGSNPDTVAIEWDWIGDADDGSVPSTPFVGKNPSIQGFAAVNAEIYQLGSVAPTVGYSVQLLNGAGIDLLGGVAASIQESSLSVTLGASVPPLYGNITLVITGQTVPLAHGRVVLYFRRVSSLQMMTPAIATASSGGGSGQFSEFYDIRRYAWAYAFGTGAVTGSLAVAGVKTVTLRPVPRGVNGSDVGHELYISGGTGTAEKVTITGGSAVSGASSGSIQFTTVNNHSGAWIIASATAGAQECYQYQLDYGPDEEIPKVLFPVGDTDIYGSLNIRDSSGIVFGYGMHETRILHHDLAAPAISAVNASVNGWRFELSGMAFLPSGGSMTSTVPTVNVQTYVVGGVKDIAIHGAGIGIKWNNTALGGNPILFSNIYLFDVQHIGLWCTSTGVGQTAGIISNLYVNGAGAAAVELDGTTGGFTLSDLWIQSVAYGILINAATRNTNEILISNSIIDGPTVAGISVTGPAIGDGSNNIRVTGSMIQTDAGGFGIILSACGKVYLSATTINSNSSQPSVSIDTSSRISLVGNTFHANGINTAPALVRMTGASTEVVVKANTFTADVLRPAGISLAAAAHTYIDIVANSIPVSGFTEPIINASTSGPVRIEGNITGMPPPVVASAGTIALPVADVGSLISITGVTPITNIVGGYAGAWFQVITPDGLSFTSGGGANGIALTVASAANAKKTIAWNSTDSLWYVG